MSRRALILFGHGARDPRWAEPFQRLQNIVQAQLPDDIVSLAFLDMMAPDLPTLVAQVAAGGCVDVKIVPIFFGQGGHVLRDLPVMVEQLRNQFPTLSLKVIDAVGESPEVLNAIAQYCVLSAGR